ncbi:uncharacterized protein LOC126986987 isoform X2 [Eriocheir sinensis]|uniref:uncharacterized protein LOC126986987 isoform X2 n=1 Tax=Eriocheir sinensis TaxID=95602 RepID=UPI0021C61CA9|nr:uncharacterized protein LOC126986987 isoform X2 [Eriocheir sinensis]XP_050699537.1 uncharacterized protein LOC126986987 isoform X2 [Eriocheir sinensis]
MAPSTAARRPLLRLALCLCLLLGHADGTEEEEEAQPQREDPNRGTERRTLPPFLMPNWKEKSDSLPTVEKNGDLYFDVAEVNETQLEIPLSGRRVRGVTATSRRCPVQSLVLGKGVLLDEDLFTHCPLKNLTLKGKKWRCLQEGRLLQRPGLVVDVEDATCSDAWHYEDSNSTLPIEYGMQEGIQKIQKFGITGCLIDNCKCNWYFMSGAYNMSMDCDGRGLTDDALAEMHALDPMLPNNVTKIHFGWNNLTSVDILMEYLRPHHENLTVLYFDHNQLTALPRLGRAFPRIKHISLTDNLIEKIDLEEFKVLVSREDLILDVANNPLRCDRNMYYLKSYIHDRCMAGWKLCTRYFKMLTCRNEPNGKPVPLYKVSKPGSIWDIDWWLFLNITLGLLNAIMITLIVDLILVLANVRGNQGRRPMMDRLVCWLKAVLLPPGSRDQGGNGQGRRHRLKK